MTAAMSPAYAQPFICPLLSLQERQVDAYVSTGDLIHAAIIHHGSQAKLSQVQLPAIARAPRRMPRAQQIRPYTLTATGAQ